MEKYFKHSSVEILIIAGFLFLWDCQVFGLDNGKEQTKTEVKIDSSKNVPPKNIKKKKMTRAYKLSNNFLFNEIVKGAAFRFKADKERFIDEKESGWSDCFGLSYDFTTLSNYYVDLLKTERKGKEKKLLIGEYHITYKKKPFFDLTYSSDGAIGIYSTIMVGGLGRQFKNGMNLESGLGIKTGNVNFKKEEYSVVNFLAGYKTLNDKSVFKLNAQVKAYLPRKYMTSNKLKGLWMVNGEFSITINKKIIGVMPAVGFSFRRDYILATINNINSYTGIVRYNVTFGFTFAKGGVVTLI